MILSRSFIFRIRCLYGSFAGHLCYRTSIKEWKYWKYSESNFSSSYFCWAGYEAVHLWCSWCSFQKWPWCITSGNSFLLLNWFVFYCKIGFCQKMIDVLQQFLWCKTILYKYSWCYKLQIMHIIWSITQTYISKIHTFQCFWMIFIRARLKCFCKSFW